MTYGGGGHGLCGGGGGGVAVGGHGVCGGGGDGFGGSLHSQAYEMARKPKRRSITKERFCLCRNPILRFRAWFREEMMKYVKTVECLPLYIVVPKGTSKSR